MREYLKREFLAAGDPRHLKLMHEFGRFMMGGTDLVEADVGLVFGSHFYKSTALDAARLYKEGHFKKIIVSGAPIMEDTGLSEAASMRDILLDEGVPEDVIFLEEQAKNSQQNVLYAKRMTETDPRFKEKVMRVIGVGPQTQSPRFLGTMLKNWPEVLCMFAPSNNVRGLSPENWIEHHPEDHPEEEPPYAILFGEIIKKTLYEDDETFGYIEPVTPAVIRKINQAVKHARLQDELSEQTAMMDHQPSSGHYYEQHGL